MKKGILLFLAMLMLFAAACSNDAQGGETQTDTSDDESSAGFELAKDGASEYIIVRGDMCEDWETDAAVSFRKAFEAVTGVTLRITTDFEKPGDTVTRPEKEIIIGKTNREDDPAEFSIDRESLGYKGYIVKTVGEKIVISAKTEIGMKEAVAYFFQEYFDYTINGSGQPKVVNTVHLSIPEEYIMKFDFGEEFFDIADRTDLVSICYTTWFDPVIDANGANDPPNITEILNGERDWGPLHSFHYWGKPALGYYRSSDKDVIRIHMTQLAEAGVDFIVIDNTNAGVGWKESDYWYKMITVSCTALLDTIVEMREEGLQTPYVVMWCGTHGDMGWSTLDAIYEEFYTNSKYDQCWVYWDERPFFLTTAIPAANDRDDITWRKMWGLVTNQAVNEWSFLNKVNKPAYDKDGNAEQICVCVAMQNTYMSLPTATGRNHGITFYNQWVNAFEARPKVITITWWNEWTAQRFEEYGQSLFVDNYNQEYSRDIEPMEGGHGDQYYQWMKQYISAYKNHEECPRLVEEGY